MFPFVSKTISLEQMRWLYPYTHKLVVNLNQNVVQAVKSETIMVGVAWIYTSKLIDNI